MTPAIKLENISKIYPSKTGDLLVLKKIDVDVGKEEFVSIIGPSGCGKTTLLKIIGGILKPTTGQVLINDQEIEKALQERKIGIVFQSPVLMRWRTAKENINLPLEIMGKKADITYLFDLIGLKGFEESYPRQLSGGMQERVSIARALVFEPSILLMDEPFGALDEITRHKMNMELVDLWQSGKTKLSMIVFVTHNIVEAIHLSDRIIVLTKRPGKIKAIVDVKLERPRNIALRDSREFVSLKKELRGLIEE